MRGNLQTAATTEVCLHSRPTINSASLGASLMHHKVSAPPAAVASASAASRKTLTQEAALSGTSADRKLHSLLLPNGLRRDAKDAVHNNEAVPKCIVGQQWSPVEDLRWNRAVPRFETALMCLPSHSGARCRRRPEEVHDV